MNKQKKRNIKMHVATNLALCTLILSVGALCFAPLETTQEVSGTGVKIYRGAEQDTGSVSLTFNVYWGTEYV